MCIALFLHLTLLKQEGASKEDIERLSKFKFRRLVDDDKLTGDAQGSQGGIMTECGSDTPIEHMLSHEDAVHFSFSLAPPF